MRTRFIPLSLLVLLMLISTISLQAQRVKTGYTVEKIELSTKGVAYLKATPVINELIDIRKNVLYPKKGYKLVALNNGAILGIVPDFFVPGKYSTENGLRITGKVKLNGLCMCAEGGGEGGCRLRLVTGELDPQGRPKYQCDGDCACKKALTIPGFRDLLNIPKKENPEGTNEWPYGSGIGG